MAHGVNGSVRLNTLLKERASIMFVRRPHYSYILLVWMYRISLKIYKILVLFRRVVTMFTKSLFANWILTFESRRTFPTSDMFFVNLHKGKGRPLTNSQFGCENKHDIVIIEYLDACRHLFERGILSHQKITND